MVRLSVSYMCMSLILKINYRYVNLIIYYKLLPMVYEQPRINAPFIIPFSLETFNSFSKDKIYFTSTIFLICLNSPTLIIYIHSSELDDL